MIVINGPILPFGRALSTKLVLGSWFGLLFAIHGLYLNWTPSPEALSYPSLAEGILCQQDSVKISKFESKSKVFGPLASSTGLTTLVRMQSNENAQAVAQHIDQLLDTQACCCDERYQGLEAFWSDDISSNFFANMGPFARLQIVRFQSQYMNFLQRLFTANQ